MFAIVRVLTAAAEPGSRTRSASVADGRGAVRTCSANVRCGSSVAEAMMRKRCGSGAEAVQKRCKFALEFPGQGYSKSARQLWCCTTYGSDGLVASEVGQCDMQGPDVVDRSALAAVHGGS